MTLSVSNLHSVEWKDARKIMNWKGFGGHRSCAAEVSYRNLPGGTEESNKNCVHINGVPGRVSNPAPPRYKCRGPCHSSGG
jgi:hypothetical protein